MASHQGLQPPLSPQIKCECYWPRDVGSSAVHGHLDLSLAAVTTLADYSIRTFAMHKVWTLFTLPPDSTNSIDL